MIRDNQRYFIAKTMRMRNWLAERGFTPIRELPDRKCDYYRVWLFDLQEEGIRDALEQYWQEKKEYIH